MVFRHGAGLRLQRYRVGGGFVKARVRARFRYVHAREEVGKISLVLGDLALDSERAYC